MLSYIVEHVVNLSCEGEDLLNTSLSNRVFTHSRQKYIL